MANPAPTINQINAFNATQGTVIDFNIIGGTELVRSNKIYIYDLSDNSLICTHLYPSTESIHELPANTDVSMEYATGKSSADFVNNKQYYAQIQTFTNTAGTQGGSGVSVAKLFWCLPSPSLTFDPIDPKIATTSYNATAKYNSNITSQSVTVPNIVQQYQFDLYTGAGSLVESSGVIVGNGTQTGATTEWTLTYNFSNLVVGSSYYFKVNVVTTEGMELNAQSSTFTVDIATPTMDKATVANDACNGYISVTSNLSSEYEHSASGDEIVSFETDSAEVVTSLKVDMEPHQSGTPWMASADDTRPYLFRQTGDGQIGHSANSAYDTLVGCSYVWNQLVADSGSGLSVTVQSGHKYLQYVGGTFSLGLSTGTAITGLTGGTDMITDLTAFATEVADYAYTLEQSQAGSGIAWLKANYPELFEYHAFSNPTMVHTLPTKKVTRGFNQWDEEWELGVWDASNGQAVASTTRIRSKNAVQVIPDATYYVSVNGFAGTFYIVWYDANDNFVGSDITNTANRTFAIPSNACYLRFFLQGTYGTTYNNDICINISKTTGTPKNGDYVQYESHEYDLGSVPLRGIPHVTNGHVWCDGDRRSADGECDRKYVELDLGSLNWAYSSGNGGFFYNNADLSQVGYGSKESDGIYATSTVYDIAGYNSSASDMENTADKTISLRASAGQASGHWERLWVKDSTYGTDADAFKTAMSGKKIVYKALTPTTETVATFTSPQLCDPNGTEQYVDNRSTPVPVGHETRYADIYDISGTTNVDVFMRGVNQWDEEWEVGKISATTGANESDNTRIRSKNYIPVMPNTTYYKQNGSSGTGKWNRLFYYDKSKAFMSAEDLSVDRTFVTPQNCGFIRFVCADVYGTTYNHDISINYPSTDTSYHPYQGADYTSGALTNYVSETETNTVPYLTKQGGSGNQLVDTLVGGSLVWNQLFGTGDWAPEASGYATVTDSNKIVTIKVTNTPSSFYQIATHSNTTIESKEGHKYLCVVRVKAPYSGSLVARDVSLMGGTINMGDIQANTWTLLSCLFVGSANATNRKPYFAPLDSLGGISSYAIDTEWQMEEPNLIDLTALFGSSTIADYLYNLEQSNTGAGVAWFKKYISNADYIPYCAPTLISSKVSAHITKSPDESVTNTYPIDPVELRGIWKIDSNGVPYCDGDVRKADGECMRRYFIANLGDYSWSAYTGTGYGGLYYSNGLTSLIAYGSNDKIYGVCEKYVAMPNSESGAIGSLHEMPNKSWRVRNTDGRIYIRDDDYSSSSAFEASLDGVYLVYELATPTTEATTPFASPQICYPNGIEQYVDNRTIPIPQGHSTKYYATDVYGGEVDLVSGVLRIDKALVAYSNGSGFVSHSTSNRWYHVGLPSRADYSKRNNAISNILIYQDSHNTYGNYFAFGASGVYINKMSSDETFSEFNSRLNGEPVIICYDITPVYVQLTPQQINTLVGQNNVWSTGDGLSIDFHIPVTALLVKRQDTSDPTGSWLTLFNQPVTQASDMDFTYIDYLNQYGKQYKYALVPLISQKQGDVDVEIEGGYTLSNAVDSVFDGVFIADADMSQRVKAGANYGNASTNQNVGSITPIGAQYPVIITNSKNRYDSGSVSGRIVPNDFYSTGNLSRTDIVAKYNEIKQFLTNKKPKVLKDWNGNIWLTMILDNVDCSFDNNYGMGMITFSANWVQVGDATNQEDLQATGMIDVGGV